MFPKRQSRKQQFFVTFDSHQCGDTILNIFPTKLSAEWTATGVCRGARVFALWWQVGLFLYFTALSPDQRCGYMFQVLQISHDWRRMHGSLCDFPHFQSHESSYASIAPHDDKRDPLRWIA